MGQAVIEAELDELPLGLAILSIALLWFLIRRWRGLEKSEKRLRAKIETNEHRERGLITARKTSTARKCSNPHSQTR